MERFVITVNGCCSNPRSASVYTTQKYNVSIKKRKSNVLVNRIIMFKEKLI